jgi:hypothetical protein
MSPARPDLYDRLSGRTGELVATVVRRCATEIPFYRRLPEEILDREVRGSVEATVQLFRRTVGLGRAPGPGDITEVIAWSGRRAEEHVPLEAALTAHIIGMEAIWAAFTELAGPGETAELAAAGAGLLSYVRSVVPAVAVAHLEEQQRGQAEAREIHRALVAALLAGQPAHGLAESAGITLAPAYVILELRFATRAQAARAAAGATRSAAPRGEVVRPETPREGPPVSGGTLRRLQSALDALTGDRVPAALDSGGGTALLPVAADAVEPALAGLPELVAGLHEALGRPLLVAAAAAADLTAVPAAAEEAAQVLDIVHRLGRPPGHYRFADVVLEYQLARPGPGLAALAAWLGPLAGRPELLDTLRTYVAYGHNRSRSAEELHIHRNTLDYRLRKVAALTGLDPAVPAQARLLDAAVLAGELGPAKPHDAE